MGFRLCLAFCLLASGLAAVLRTAQQSRLRSHLLSESWVSRANAAVLLADNPRALPWLMDASEDEAPPVRRNALWALHRLTGLPWASNRSGCVAWYRTTGGSVAAAPGSLDQTWQSGEIGEQFEFTLTWNGEDLVAEIENRTPVVAGLTAGVAEDYSAVLYGPGGRVVRVLDPPDAEPGVAEILVSGADGRVLGIWFWQLNGISIPAHRAASGTFDMSAIPRGTWVAELRVGPLGLLHGGTERTAWTQGVRRTLVIRR